MGQIIPKQVVCPHCKLIMESWGWSEYLRCEKCQKIFQIEKHVGSEEEGTIHKLTEKIDGFFNDEKKESIE